MALTRTKKESIRVVVEAAANQTWATQVATLKTTYNTLSDSEKTRSFIRTFDNATKGIFKPSYLLDEGIYSRGAATSSIFQASMNLKSVKYYESVINTSGVVEITDKSERTNADKLQLCVYS